MKEIYEKLSKQLTKDDVELRIGTTSKNGFSLLLYKTARTDVRRLNESGAIWKNEHNYDPMGLMTCTISVWDSETGQWVDRTDVGTESNTEAQKGLYSDSFKRAGFRWGIGLELYNAPFIWVNWQMEQRGNKYAPVGFFPSNLNIAKYEVEDGHFKELTITYNGDVVYQLNKKPPKKISGELHDLIVDLIADTESDEKKLLEYYGVKSLKDLTADQAKKAITQLKRKLK